MEYEIFWNDLKPEVQKELLELMGDNGNYDVVPIATIVIDTPIQNSTEMHSELKMWGD